MGCCLGCLVCECACCAGKAVGKVFEIIDHKGGRVSSAILFFLIAIISWIFRNWGYDIFQHWKGSKILDCGTDAACYSTLSVFRITFVLAIFHIIMAILTIGIASKKDARLSVQNGWWLIKILFLVGFFVGTMYIPNVVFEYFGWIALGAAVLFLLIQLIYLVDFAHAWAENWIGHQENSAEGDKRWWGVLLSTTIFFYILCLIAIILMGAFFCSKGCSRNIAFIIIDVILIVIMSICSILPKVQEANPKSGLLQPAIISVYITYLALSSMMSASDGCNPWYDRSGEYHATILIGLLFTILTICLTTYQSASKFEVDLENSGSKAQGSETKEAIFHFSRFHLIFFLGALYLAMLMTDWRTVSNPGTSTKKVDSGPAAVWVKIATSWLCALIYLWTLAGPVLFPDREWYPQRKENS